MNEHEREDVLWAAIESGTLDDAAADTAVASRFAAHQKLESLFKRLGEPSTPETLSNCRHKSVAIRFVAYWAAGRLASSIWPTIPNWSDPSLLKCRNQSASRRTAMSSGLCRRPVRLPF